MTLVIMYVMGLIVLFYVAAMVVIAKYTANNSNIESTTNNNNDNIDNNVSPGLRNKKKKDDWKPGRVYSREEWGDKTISYPAERGWGHGVKPQVIVDSSGTELQQQHAEDQVSSAQNHPPQRILKAYSELVDQSQWKEQPLPVRKTTANDLTVTSFPHVNSCSRLPEQWPADEFPDIDPFLPWIHDVFPTHDGQFIQFVAQNKRRCKTGTNSEEIQIAKHMAPQVALFQHVAVKRIADGDDTTRYKLTSHEEADEDGMTTRFICRFSNGEETLSVFNFSYEWASYRKKMRQMFHEDGRDNKQIHTSQLLFKCPVPQSLVETVRTGSSVKYDYATLFVDVVPIRTPPRYDKPNVFLPPYYKEFREEGFDPAKEWGDKHILPKIEDSGRWENIPICKPTLLTYGKQQDDSQALAKASADEKEPVKQHRLVSCLWASTGYATRGNRFAINDGQRRLLEWITYNKLIGVEHFYLYDNSGAFTTDTSLQPVADMFPNDVTVIKWPAKVCNNNKNNVDSVGERSSQYAAEASCRLRFGPHTDWVAQVSIHFQNASNDIFLVLHENSSYFSFLFVYSLILMSILCLWVI
jgi:hypothetical protein